ncbi:MAG: hypothetical protein B9S38_02540 [Verrucomicrobiia bacterium Tous-C4TDCM]|nr:MAG: hypothetical protein B9S38_02540 [Verrucomicrobiae bacterium Tous-C4TDCM]
MRRFLPSAFAWACLPAAAAPLQFNRDIRPILSEKCFACHGFDAKHREADLRLDEPEAAFKPDKHGNAAIVPGKPDDSLLWDHITSTDEDEIMPPPESKKALSDVEKATLRRWIEEGAGYQKHWAFEGPAKPAVPEGAGTEIDRFITAALMPDGLALSPEADRPTLIRRVSMALRGLPPTIEEIDTFLADTAPDAYEKMVDRFLASPHYGEEMARHWLDVARYADTHGLHLDNERQTWAYRDWVVAAFNRNLPYDQFTIEQLAGDLLPEPTQDQLIATGFNRCNVTTSEGGSIDAEYVFRYAVDRASTTAQAFLGLTAGCAVCHDHKYDPITAKDFYSLYAFFHSNADPAMDGNALLTQPVLKVKPAGYDEKMAEFAGREAAVRKSMDERAATVAYQDPAGIEPKPPVTTIEQVWFEDSFPQGAQIGTVGHPLTYADAPVHSGAKSLKRGGDGVAQDYYESGASPFEVPQDPVFFVHVYLDPADLPEEVMIQFHSDGWKHRALWGQDIIEFGAKGTTERHVAGPLPAPGQWVKLEVPGASMGLTAGTKIAGYAFTVHGGTVYFDKLGVRGRTDPASDPALSFTAWRTAQAGKDTPGVPGDLNGWLKEGPDKPRTPEEQKRILEYYVQQVCATTRQHFAPMQAELAAIAKEREAYDGAAPSTFVFKDLPQPRDSHVMIRGQYDKPGEKVEPNTPVVLPPLQKAGPRANRLDLAKWLVARENPLTARVAVNRFWQQVHGTGLVKSSHDFGTQGALPSHPELLDWLSLWFQDNGWDVKKLMRLMLTSSTFRQQSIAPPVLWQSDPGNVRLARGPRFRLDAEQIRDQALFIGGLIRLQTGGKGVNPYQPPNIWEPVGFGGSNTQNYRQDTGDALYRRSLYTFLKRTAPHPLMSNFDAPNREQSCIARERSNTPLQALQLMNDVQHFEAARAFAQRIMTAAATPQDRLTFAYRSALARPPAPEESAMVLEFYQRQLAKYQAAPAEAKKAVTFGESKPPADLPESELAAWALVANLILNLDEAVIRN